MADSKNAEALSNRVNQGRGMETRIKHIIDEVMDIIYENPHVWQSEYCATCNHISKLLGKKFGCVRHMAEHSTSSV